MYNANQEEQEILKFWESDKTFEKSVNTRPADKPYVFYDGPPFATGLPHYGHILASVIKDVVPRYWTMKGYRVPRQWIWDCHGLPIESIIEKELGISSKKQIEDEFGVDKFNNACHSKVLMYVDEWKKMVTRVGRWVNYDNSAKTMDPTYMESVWWSLKTIWEKGLIYEGRKVLMYCPHCETPVSKAEIAMDNSYKDITEESVTVKFKVKDPAQHGLPENTYLLAWTTTPWTLPGNVALAVGNDIDYLVLESNTSINRGMNNGILNLTSGHYIIAAERLESITKEGNYFTDNVIKIKGSDLVGLEYVPLFDMPAMQATGKKAYYVAAADFVTTVDGTGVVHTAVIYGEDDYNLGLKLDLPMVPMLTSAGEFNESVPEFLRGKYFKQAEKEIKKYLDEKKLLFSREQFTHSYPHCWRCDTQLIYNAISAWFINIQKIKDRLIELNEKINWFPDHLKHGRFLNILETAPDWNISRNRYWATPLPFWKCENKDCASVVCVGSVAELKEKALNFSEIFTTDRVEKIDLHKQYIDKIKLLCENCKGTMERIPEVVDCWVESGSVPFGPLHYPFENKETFSAAFPGQFIAEYINQTRAWFYYTHVMSVLLFDSNSFENCVTTGEIQNEKGEKLSKSKKNYPDPWLLIEQYGVDTIRYYLMTSVVMEADNLLFNEREIRELYNKVINILWNVVTFYQTYAPEYDGHTPARHSQHVLDKWILAKLQVLVTAVTTNMDNYNTVKAGRPIKDFIDDLSTWYLRRSRDRFKGADAEDKQAAIATHKEVLEVLSKIMAPFTPFIAEKIWQTVSGSPESVHLQVWPKMKPEHHQPAIIDEMNEVRKIVEMGLALRAETKLKVRQPLAEFRINKENIGHELRNIIAEELNVKKVDFAEAVVESDWAVKTEGEVTVWLNTTISEELKKEGWLREVVRAINQQRKEAGLTISDRISIQYAASDNSIATWVKEVESEICAATLANEMKEEGEAVGVKLEFDANMLTVGIKKI